MGVPPMPGALKLKDFTSQNHYLCIARTGGTPVSHWTMKPHRGHFLIAIAAACGVAFVASCKREERSFRVPPPVAELSETFDANTPVRPGPDAPGTASTSQPVSLSRV